MSKRVHQLNKLIQRELSEILLTELADNNAIVTITEVQVSPDTSYAKVFLAIHENPQEVLKLLNGKLYHIQGLLNKRLHMKKLPRIRFELDNSDDKVVKIEELLSNPPHEPSD